MKRTVELRDLRPASGAAAAASKERGASRVKPEIAQDVGFELAGAEELLVTALAKLAGAKKLIVQPGIVEAGTSGRSSGPGRTPFGSPALGRCG